MRRCCLPLRFFGYDANDRGTEGSESYQNRHVREERCDQRQLRACCIHPSCRSDSAEGRLHVNGATSNHTPEPPKTLFPCCIWPCFLSAELRAPRSNEHSSNEDSPAKRRFWADVTAFVFGFSQQKSRQNASGRLFVCLARNSCKLSDIEQIYGGWSSGKNHTRLQRRARASNPRRSVHR